MPRWSRVPESNRVTLRLLAPVRGLLHIRVGEHEVLADDPGQLVVRSDEPTQRAHGGPEGVELFDCHSVLVVRLAEVGHPVVQLRNNLRGDGIVDPLDRVLEIVVDEGFTEDQLWFNGDIETTREEGFRRIRAEHPDAIVQCPIAWLSPLVAAAPVEAHQTLEMLTSWGISRFSVDWNHYRAREMFDELVGWGYEANFYSVPDLEAFLEAVVLLPSSVTSDFNFPQWHRYGRGSGREGRRITYQIDTEGDR